MTAHEANTAFIAATVARAAARNDTKAAARELKAAQRREIEAEKAVAAACKVYLDADAAERWAGRYHAPAGIVGAGRGTGGRQSPPLPRDPTC